MRRLLLAAAFVAVLAPGTPAWAHATLVSADPAKEATLTTAPATVRLRFSGPLNPDYTTIVVSDAAKQRIPAAAAVTEAAYGTVTLGRPLGNGTYTVAYRVVSVDGHTIQGSYPFSVADPAQVAPAAAAPDGNRVIPLLLAAAGVALAAFAAYWYVSRRRRPSRSVPGSQS